MEYINQYYSEKYQGSRPKYNTDGYQLTEYKGLLISKRSDVEFHVISSEICIGIYAGINGAKDFIDKL